MSKEKEKEKASKGDSKDAASAATIFPVGPAGKRELRRALIRSKDPVNTITSFQQAHSLHSMMSRAFDTIPRHAYKSTRNSTHGVAESLDTDSVMTFLHHLGVRQHEVHKRISDNFLKQLETEIRKTTLPEPLLELLKQSWAYATTLPELRPIIWAVLKQLGPQTPLPVLIALAERETLEDGKIVLKHADIFRPLPASFKRLTWEADWDNRTTPTDNTIVSDDHEYVEQVQSTLLFETIAPSIYQYMNSKVLVEAANKAFVATTGERKVLTTQRRALTKTSLLSQTTSTAGGATTTASLIKSAAAAGNKDVTAAAVTVEKEHPLAQCGKAVSQLRSSLCDTVGTASSYRPKLLYALLSMLMAQHGGAQLDFKVDNNKTTANKKKKKRKKNDISSSLLGGAKHLHCTLVADLLLSAGGPLPKQYTPVLSLARTLDDCVQEGNITDANIVKLQAALKNIFQPESAKEAEDDDEEKKKSLASSNDDKDEPTGPTTSVKRQLNKLIQTGLDAMKEADPQHLFLNPVTDEIAPGYSKIISRPMCIVTMEEKVARNEYSSVLDWETDVKLMFKNCVDYNRGAAGQWFRGEAKRQGKVFREDNYPQVRRQYQTEIAKQSVLAETNKKANINTGKRDADAIAPLPPSSKKRKKEKEEFIPSMPALASMLLADPFAVRVILARILRELRRGVLAGNSLPSAHNAIPSLLQILHLSRWSTQVCAIRGKKFLVPPAGFDLDEDSAADPTARIPYTSLRRCLPVLLRLLLEAEFDKRTAPGGDLHTAAQNATLSLPPITQEAWEGGAHMQVAVALVEGALVHICQPGNGSETSLVTSFPKFASALNAASISLLDDSVFFRCLIFALLRHKTKLLKDTRDAVVTSWLKWLRCEKNDEDEDEAKPKKGSMTSAAHECFVMLLNEWSALGNVVLPRDRLLTYSVQAVQAADESERSEKRKFVTLWKSEDPPKEFLAIKREYERMLKHLPEANAQHWKEETGLEEKKPEPEPSSSPEQQPTPDASPERPSSPMEEDDGSPDHLPSPTGMDDSPEYPASPV